jgi:hypothetical protein
MLIDHSAGTGRSVGSSDRTSVSTSCTSGSDLAGRPAAGLEGKAIKRKRVSPRVPSSRDREHAEADERRRIPSG